MNPPSSDSPSPFSAEIETRLQSLMKLRAQMLQLHARLEYLRLMLRLAGPGQARAWRADDSFRR